MIEQRGDVRCGTDHLFEIVEHDQDAIVTNPSGKLLERAVLSGISKVKCTGDSRHHKGWIRNGRQRNDSHAAWKERFRIFRQPQRQPCLANPAGTSERQEPAFVTREQRMHCRDLSRPADEGGHEHWINLA